MQCQKIDQLLIIHRRLLMASAEADHGIKGRGKCLHMTVVFILFVQEQKHKIILGKAFLFQLFFGNPDADLAEKDQRIRLFLLQAADRKFQVEIRFRLQGIADAHHTERRQRHKRNLIENRIFCVLNMLEPVVNFPLYQLEFPFFLLDQRFLVPQFFFDYRNFPVLHVFL